MTCLRTLLIAALATGCGFSVAPATSPAGPDAGDDEPTVDATPPSTLLCDTADPSLRLCMSFEGATPFADQSGLGHDASTTDVAMIDRSSTDQVAGMALTSTMHVAESSDLDLPADFAFEMWISSTNVPGGLRYWLLDNNQQYFMSYGDTRHIRCGIGSKVVDSVQTLDTSWHHVACSFTATTGKLEVYVDGVLGGCSDPINAASTSGHDGLAIGANLSGSSFTERYVGLLDNVHIYARSLAAAEICTHAGKTGCAATCPTPPE